MKHNDISITVVGMGYVGLPLAVSFAKNYKVTGYDIDESRIEALQNNLDWTLEVSREELQSSHNLSFVSEISPSNNVNFYIITVPTPINQHNQPDLEPLLSASMKVGAFLKKGDYVVYESTVYPGATEEDCVPILEKHSNLKLNKDFFVGYSPERINPGDKTHKLSQIIKITSGSTPKASQVIDNLYKQIIDAGTYPVSSIKVAEAAKVIENTQRDLNIGLINELAIIFNRLNIDTEEVINAASTKWNFIPFSPGLVGGHCIGVDPFYLTYKAQSVGYQPELILAARRLNDSMAKYVCSELVKTMINKTIDVAQSKILIMGITFKENCPDLRNTKVIHVGEELLEYGASVDYYDPWVKDEDRKKFKNIELLENPKINFYDAIILAVAHDEFKELGLNSIKKYGKKLHIIYDLKYLFPARQTDLRL